MLDYFGKLEIRKRPTKPKEFFPRTLKEKVRRLPMRKSAIVGTVGVFLVCLACCGEEPAGKAAKPEKPVVVPVKPVREAKVLDKEELMRFLPKAPKGWKASKPVGSTQRMGPLAYTKVSRSFTKGTQRIQFILDDLGTINPYFSMKEEPKIKEEKTEDGYRKKLMLGKVAAQEVFDGKKKESLIFVVFEKRVQLNVVGTGVEDNSVAVGLAKSINFEELKKTLEEKSK